MPWRQWLRSGTVIVTLLTLVALLATLRGIESDLARRVDGALVVDGQGWATAEVSGRVVTVMGTAPTVLAQRLAQESAQRVWGVAEAIDGTGLIPLERPYSWRATRGQTELRIGGFAPSEEARRSILAAAALRLPDVALIDEMKLARGQPSGFLVLVDYTFRRLAELSEGTVTLTDTRLSVDGTAADEAAYAEIQTALAGPLPSEATLTGLRILPPHADSFRWEARYDGKAVTIDGFAPSEPARAEIAAAARQALPGATLADTTRLASGAPVGFTSAAAFALYQLAYLTSGSVVIDNGTLAVKGTARSVDAYEAAIAEIEARRDRRLSGVLIDSADILPASVDPYVWRAERNGDSATVTGYVPSEAARDEITRALAARLPGVRIENRMRVAEGDPRMDWIGALKFAIEQLSRLAKGSVSLSGPSYEITGEAASAAAYTALVERLKTTLPASMTLRRQSIAPAAIAPFVFSAAQSGDTLLLGGYVPTDETAQAIVAAARPKFGNVTIEMRLLLAGGAPDGFVTAVTAGLQALSRLEGGTFDLTDRKLTLTGAVHGASGRASIESALAEALPEGFEPTLSLTEVEDGPMMSAEECQTALRGEAAKGRIDFGDNDDRLQLDAFGLLDRIAAVARRCPGATIEVGGHTDSGGGRSRNQALSERRAQAVVDYLVAAGVRPERLAAVGYGESRPIASNSNAAGRIQNRRIEFNVVGQ
ncbi:OmpA family protein [Prosthecomicrobium pneumaticum]|uniref:Outer membrane protein OmpA-like peptidoglycan-associated protein n=1 Tax=Prosthecomicrobium pneumaticum TaxID=81895 RepID=A0A7W9CSN2_9HYPH|nr:OmpA family protein [Prosthecomicrobium pneumaticum]MBB5751185.1 outer membrane protein OmpA-like peptidoglycan-associated protein [Prosthecomicrobium pneumaticum]